MNVAVRADASREIGTGHFMRCLTLAGALRQRGAHVRFVSRQAPEHLRDLVGAHGCEFTLLDASSTEGTIGDLPHAHWLGTSQAADADATVRALSGQAWDWIVVDHYAVDARWESALRPVVKHVFVIDDLADRVHDCDVLLDQNLHPDPLARYASYVSARTQCLFGPYHALLRPEFVAARRASPRGVRGLDPVRKVSICFGGVDEAGVSVRALEALKPWLSDRDLAVGVIVGEASPNLQVLREWAIAFPTITLHVSPGCVADLLAAADLGLGATGSMTWERASVGLPSIAMSVALNQHLIGENAGHAGLLVYVGESDNVCVEAIHSAVARVMADGPLRQRLADCSLTMVDGLGAQRVAETLRHFRP